MVQVLYDGSYPATCMGKLTINVDGETIYQKDFCCHSTGTVWFDDEWNEYVEQSNLVWNEEESELFSKEIQEAVKEKLEQYRVCCGGCI